MSVICPASPRSHSLRPGSWDKPNFGPNDGRRISPSKRRTFWRCLRARAVAKFPQTILLPSSGIVLVMSSFWMDRLCWSCLRRTPKKRKASAPKLLFAVRQTSRLSGDGETGSDRHWPRSIGPKCVASLGTSRSTDCRRSVASASCSGPMPSRSDSDLCSASNMVLMLNPFECVQPRAPGSRKSSRFGFWFCELSSQVAEGESPYYRGEYQASSCPRHRDAPLFDLFLFLSDEDRNFCK